MKKELSQKQKTHTILSLLLVLIGILLIIYMVSVEGELGALPLLILLGGTVWFIVNRVSIRKQTQ